MSDEGSVVSPIWDISAKPLNDDSIQTYDYFELRESNVNVKTLTKFEFITKDTGNYLLPSQAYMHIKIKIIDSLEENVSFVNNGFNIFSSCEYEIEKAKIENVDHVGITTTIQNLVDYSEDYSKSTASNQFWFPDTAEGCDSSRFKYHGVEDTLDTSIKLKNVISRSYQEKNINKKFENCFIVFTVKEIIWIS